MDHTSNLTRRFSFRSSNRLSTLALVGLCILAGLAVGLISAFVNPLYLLAAVPIMAVGVWALRDDARSLWLIVAVIGILPRFAAPIKLGVTPTFLDLALILLLAAWFVRSAAHPLRIREIPIALPLLSLIIVAIATFIVGLPNGALTPLILRRFAEMMLSLALVFVLVSVMCTRDVLVWTMRVLILVGALAAFIGIVLYVMPEELAIRLLSALAPFGYPTGATVLHFVNDDPALAQRATGLWIDPNAFGGYLLISGALALPQLFTRKPVLPRWLAILSVGLIGLALASTLSRGAMLGLLCVALLLGALRYRRLLVLSVVVVALVLVLPYTRDLVVRFAEGFAVQDLATQMRFGEYKDALRLIQRYPLLGVGFADTPDVDLYIGVSNMYLLVAQQMGLLGLTAFVATIVTLFVSAFRHRQFLWPDESLSAIWLGALGAIVGALVSGIFDHYFFNIDFHNSVMLLWLVIALAVSTQIVGVSCYNRALWKSA
jgi:O-antigen ligase